MIPTPAAALLILVIHRPPTPRPRRLLPSALTTLRQARVPPLRSMDRARWTFILDSGAPHSNRGFHRGEALKGSGGSPRIAARRRQRGPCRDSTWRPSSCGSDRAAARPRIPVIDLGKGGRHSPRRRIARRGSLRALPWSASIRSAGTDDRGTRTFRPEGDSEPRFRWP